MCTACTFGKEGNNGRPLGQLLKSLAEEDRRNRLTARSIDLRVLHRELAGPVGLAIDLLVDHYMNLVNRPVDRELGFGNLCSI